MMQTALAETVSTNVIHDLITYDSQSGLPVVFAEAWSQSLLEISKHVSNNKCVAGHRTGDDGQAQILVRCGNVTAVMKGRSFDEPLEEITAKTRTTTHSAPLVVNRMIDTLRTRGLTVVIEGKRHETCWHILIANLRAQQKNWMCLTVIVVPDTLTDADTTAVLYLHFLLGDSVMTSDKFENRKKHVAYEREVQQIACEIRQGTESNERYMRT